ncbi:hypothetical protein [Methanosarcina sp. UBA5]|uniref:hypothetical protein n=1 Tax=Methanosarcina sp. UBA5 TaxID=1915593 RepID=UPI0025CF6E7A|nr:hypothetical protein [Methanosarcina sp. UBA5]
MTASNKENLDLEVNPTCTVNECIIEPLTDDSFCTKSSLSSIPIEEDVKLTGEKDVELTELAKPTKSKTLTAKQFVTQRKRKTYTATVPSGVKCLDISVTGIHNNYKLSLTIYTPTGECCGTFYGTGNITRRIFGAGNKQLPQGKWRLVVSGDEGYKVKVSRHC